MLHSVKKFAPFIYIALLVAGYFYVGNVLKREDVKVTQVEETPKNKEEPKPIKVTLWLYNGASITNRSFEMTNEDSITQLLETARAEGFFYYELVKYLDRDEIWFNGQKPELNSSWQVFHNDINVTNQLDDTKLVTGGSYSLKLVSFVP